MSAQARTIQDCWKEYRDMIYPDGVYAEQSIQLHRAFFAGAQYCVEQLNKLSELPEEVAVVELQKLAQEIIEQLRSSLPPRT